MSMDLELSYLSHVNKYGHRYRLMKVAPDAYMVYIKIDKNGGKHTPISRTMVSSRMISVGFWPFKKLVKESATDTYIRAKHMYIDVVRASINSVYPYDVT